MQKRLLVILSSLWLSLVRLHGLRMVPGHTFLLIYRKEEWRLSRELRAFAADSEYRVLGTPSSVHTSPASSPTPLGNSCLDLSESLRKQNKLRCMIDKHLDEGVVQ